MKPRILIAGLMFVIVAFSADTGAELFQKAVTQERAAGNLEEAIKLYQRVAKEFASDRPLAAKSLVQEARCYEKLGQDRAVKLYEQVARDFGDQRELAATASARLAVLKQGEHTAQPVAMTQRKIELPFIAISSKTDGQREIYVDYSAGAVMTTDLAGKDKRLVFKPKAGDYVVGMAPSRDFSNVALSLWNEDGSWRLAVIKTDGTNYREVPEAAPFSCPPEWSWDNRYIFACGRQPDGTYPLLRISVADGQVRKMGGTDTYIIRVSPDGHFIALANSPTAYGKVVLVPAEEGEPSLVSDSGRIVDWTRDGRYLVIASARFGSEALYLLPIKEPVVG